MNAMKHTVESLQAEIERIVDERQELRRNGADVGDLEANRTRLAFAQAKLSNLLVQRHLSATTAA
jgi:hypothetical protein